MGRPPLLRPSPVLFLGWGCPCGAHYYRLGLSSHSLAKIGATFAVAWLFLLGLATPERCWKTTLDAVGVFDLSLILGGVGVCAMRCGGLPRGVWGPLLRRPWIALFVSLRLA